MTLAVAHNNHDAFQLSIFTISLLFVKVGIKKNIYFTNRQIHNHASSIEC